ncbi:hypothetical protein AB7M49_007035 [Bradyrhizobium elkanii]|uniref:Uncharacterized protein n=1 Tax=Bradyrhizobium elkanii TaxID=29448 RepID=A0A8I2C8S6_BRAEL|nr:hypothetical protein [Bradyrhizobium elkanii]MCP1931499.1 hypothetical protein [Bradyrhizobium elkanii]MCP1970022.1 hypothetical protein [Bradyrhizobium elkanii]MCS3480377.1 hypothetical protein [Bradyrhizobium elkanii]MCS3577974.1 hypothetical protein [Bradyrhizobium elkanii]
MTTAVCAAKPVPTDMENGLAAKGRKAQCDLIS